jgi:hypothetical protein
MLFAPKAQTLVRDLKLIVDVFISTLPLTVAITIILATLKRDKLPIIGIPFIINGATLIGNWLHWGMRPVTLSFGTSVVGGLPGFMIGMMHDYWKAYGALPFLKSCVVGYAFGRWF